MADLHLSEDSVIDRLFTALSDGDLVAARSCCMDDAVFWHSFDQLAMNMDEIAKSWEDFFKSFPARNFVDVRRQSVGDGFLQQHLMVATLPNGDRRGWPACILVKLENGRIKRLDEYLDRAGSFPVSPDSPTTPGLPRQDR